eukprot:6193945-Pleurochrysis_carterae.AAC.2
MQPAKVTMQRHGTMPPTAQDNQPQKCGVQTACTPTRNHAKSKQRFVFSQMCDCWPAATPNQALLYLVKSFVTRNTPQKCQRQARGTVQATFKCPESVPAQAASNFTRCQALQGVAGLGSPEPSISSQPQEVSIAPCRLQFSLCLPGTYRRNESKLV